MTVKQKEVTSVSTVLVDWQRAVCVLLLTCSDIYTLQFKNSLKNNGTVSRYAAASIEGSVLQGSVIENKKFVTFARMTKCTWIYANQRP